MEIRPNKQFVDGVVDFYAGQFRLFPMAGKVGIHHASGDSFLLFIIYLFI
jgi:hypothetical protein